MRQRIIRFVIFAQSILFLGHIFIFETWKTFQTAPPAAEINIVRVALAALSVTFVSASLLAFRYSNPLIRGYYRVAAVWLGLLTYFFLASVASWLVYGAAYAFGFAAAKQGVAFALFGAALVAEILLF